MRTIILYFAVTIVASLYLFPFEFVFLPGINTKMCLALMGGVLILMHCSANKCPLLNKEMLVLIILALMVSLCGFLSTTINNTNDYTYATYIVSMVVWVSAAYLVINVIRSVHNRVSTVILCNYIIAVCVFQCLSAIAIDSVPLVKELVNRYILGFGFEKNVLDLSGNRLYGIGAALDVAGSRFSIALIMCAYLLSRERSFAKTFLYTIAFIIIGIIGNMISRTTTVGMVLSIVYILYSTIVRKYNSHNTIVAFMLVLLAVIPSTIILYKTDAHFHGYIDFAFEGFFNIAEKGKWETHSNAILRNMYRFPDTFKTWLIGDGYFDNPTSDPYYSGYMWKGFYMGTDVGYLRFIFYFGLLGLATFSIFMVKTCMACCDALGRHKKLFVAVLMINFIVWFKVSTDIFLMFALFLCLDPDEENRYYEQIDE